MPKVKKPPPDEISRRLYKIQGMAVANKRYRPAIAIYEKYLRRYALTANQQYQLALLYDHIAMMNQGRLKKKIFHAYLKKAEGLYCKILKENPRYFHALYGVGRIYHIKKEYKKGLRFQIRAYRQMLKLPRNQRGALAIGSIYESLGDYKNAERWYRKEHHDAPRRDFGTTLNLFLFYRKHGNRRKALRYAHTTEKLLPLEYKKKIYQGLKMQDSKFVKYIKREIKRTKEN